MIRIHKFAIAIATAGLLTASTAPAALHYYHFVYSGAAYTSAPNTAKAEGTFTVDDTVLANPGSNDGFFTSGSVIVDITMTVSGATSGNGNFTTSDFGNCYFAITDALNLNTEWVGQAQPSTGTTWGDYTLSGGDGNDLNFLAATPGAPDGVFFFLLGADGGSAEQMPLVSVTPEVLNPGELNAGETVFNVPGATVASLKPASISNGGRLFLRSKIKGPGVTSADAACLLSWDPNFSVARTLVRAGDSLYGLPIKTFGDPDASGGNLIFKASLAVAGGVTKDNNDVIALVNQGGSTSSLIGLLREGDDALISGGFHFTKFTWFHGVAATSQFPPQAVVNGIGPAPTPTSGVFIGALVENATGATKGQGCWYSDGFSVTPIVYSGGSVVIDGVTKTVKTVSKPTVSSPAQAEGRVGNTSAISLLIKTTDGITALKTFDAPSSVVITRPSAKVGTVAKPHYKAR